MGASDFCSRATSPTQHTCSYSVDSLTSSARAAASSSAAERRVSIDSIIIIKIICFLRLLN